MNFVRFKTDRGISYGIMREETIIPVQGSIYGDFQEAATQFGPDEVELLAPCVPSKILCLGLNYRDHAEEIGLPLPKWPIVFMKPATSVIGPGGEIIYPSLYVKRLDYEAELGVVIKKTARNVPENQALDFVLGYTCANDVTARNLQPKDGQWTISKSFDTFMPLGPVIATGIPWNSLEISSTLNGIRKQSSNTKNLIFGVPFLVSYLSNIMTLLPGDVIITGTPSGISGMEPGDEITVSVAGIGALTNRVVKK